MDTIFTNSENIKTSEPLLNLLDKINLKRHDKCYFINPWHVLTWKNIEKSYKNNKFKISTQSRMKNLIYLT